MMSHIILYNESETTFMRHERNKNTDQFKWCVMRAKSFVFVVCVVVDVVMYPAVMLHLVFIPEFS